jgi:endonuclease/exonuclease/phosphatase (EEP) superfamily protein YafD
VQGTTWPALTAVVDQRFTLVAGHAVPPVPNDVGRWQADLRALDGAARSVRPAGRVVLLGNLNATPWHQPFRVLTRPGLQDAADLLGKGLRPTWPTWSPLSVVPLDHALLGPRLGVRSVDALAVRGTDHRALLVTLLVPGR